MQEIKEKTALSPFAPTNGGQPSHDSNHSVLIPDEKINDHFDGPPEEDVDAMLQKLQRLTDPHYLHTVSMTELYQTSYKSRPPIIDGLLYAGAYILAGAPKIGKSFLVAQLAYHIGTGDPLWGSEVR